MAIPFVAPIVEINTWSPKKMKQDIQNDYDALKENGWWARFFSNHDKPRQVSLYGNDKEYWEVSAKMLAMLLHSLPGTPFVYQGEEIGMTNMRFPYIEDYNDPDAKNTYHQHILAGDTPDVALKEAQMISRDNARTPGCSGTQPKTPASQQASRGSGINPNYTKINAESQKNDPTPFSAATKRSSHCAKAVPRSHAATSKSRKPAPIRCSP